MYGLHYIQVIIIVTVMAKILYWLMVYRQCNLKKTITKQIMQHNEVKNNRLRLVESQTKEIKGAGVDCSCL